MKEEHKKNVLVVYGTRPELIKLAPLIIHLRDKAGINLTTVSTGQHKEMLFSLEELFGIKPDVSLEVMTDNQTVNQVVSKVISEMEYVFKERETDLVFVQGDTATVLATAMAAYFRRIKIAHVEAGLRSFDLDHPFPEEFNRRTVSIIADYNFAPTALSAQNLKNEGVSESKILITGNTVIDALQMILPKLEENRTPKLKILVTAHRRENHGEGIRSICIAIKELLKKNQEVEFVWPVHPNPNVKEVVLDLLATTDRVTLIEPLGYIDLLREMKSADLVWTDSGGIQEETPTLKKPVLILREVTERPEVVNAGFGFLVGTDVDKIVSKSMQLLENKDYYQKSISGDNPFGSGNACEKIANFVFN
jgi:UDP-N-acetylglucosamine 2-epimerase (non-hydrolysing)